MKICSPANKRLKSFWDDLLKPINFDIVKAFHRQNGKFLGEGSFSSVKQIDINIDKWKSYAVKFTQCKEPLDHLNTLTEIELMIKMTKKNSKAIPSIYSCVYDGPSANGIEPSQITKIYTLMTPLSGSLTDLVNESNVAQLSKKNFIKIILSIVEGLKEMWEEGYAHSDIKTDNVLWDSRLSKFRIIDFNLAIRTNQIKRTQGTPGYVSVGLFRKTIPLEQRDDLYSTAILAVYSLYEGGEEEFDADLTSGNKQLFLIDMDDRMKQKLIKAATQTFANYGFGDFQSIDTPLETMNFTTLMVMLILYDIKKWTHDEVIQVMERLIKETGNENMIFSQKKIKLVDYSRIFKISRENCLKDFIINPIWKKTGIKIKIEDLENDGCKCRIGKSSFPKCDRKPFYAKYEQVDLIKNENGGDGSLLDSEDEYFSATENEHDSDDGSVYQII